MKRFTEDGKICWNEKSPSSNVQKRRILLFALDIPTDVSLTSRTIAETERKERLVLLDGSIEIQDSEHNVWK